MNRIIFLSWVFLTTLFNFTYAQDTSSEEIDINAWDKATNIYKCIENLKSENEQVYEEANECLYYLLPRHSTALLKELSNKDPIVRGRLSMLFGKRQMKEATPAIIKLLDDKNMSVRKEAVYALSVMKDPKSIPALLKLIHEGEYSIQSGSIGTILELRDSASKEDIAEIKKVLMENLQNPKERIRRSAVRYLGEMKDPSVIPILEDLSQNDTGFYLENTPENVKKTEKKTFPVREAALKSIEKLKQYLVDQKMRKEHLQSSTTTQ